MKNNKSWIVWYEVVSFSKSSYCTFQNWTTVEPLTNDHPHLRPPAFYDRFFIDGMSTLYKCSLTNDHPADTTNDHGNLNFTPDERPSDRWPAHLLT